jgi:hypothetical protein
VTKIPPAILIYGVLGLVPFLAPPVIDVTMPALADYAATALAAYGALILSFLGGARWGLAIGKPVPNVTVISLAMLPTLAGLALLMLPAGTRTAQLTGLAVALALHWVWDWRGTDLPPWYARLRTILTIGAVAGLLAGAVALPP